MKQLVIIRDGAQNSRHRLSAVGVEQIKHVAKQLAPHLKGPRVHVCASKALRAMDSAYVLSAALDGWPGTPRFFQNLWSDAQHQQDNENALSLIFEGFQGIDTLLVVTHLAYTRDLPTLFAKRALGKEVPRVPLKKGHARLIDCETKEVIYLA